VLLSASEGGERIVSNKMPKVRSFASVAEGDGLLLAPQHFVGWLKTYRKTDRLGLTYQYHPRSDAHSKKLAELIWDDLVAHCPEEVGRTFSDLEIHRRRRESVHNVPIQPLSRDLRSGDVCG
jgi:hypothetical protein